MAQRILEFHRKNGPFRRVEDLMNVRRIGEKKFLKIRNRSKRFLACLPPLDLNERAIEQ